MQTQRDTGGRRVVISRYTLNEKVEFYVGYLDGHAEIHVDSGFPLGVKKISVGAEDLKRYIPIIRRALDEAERNLKG